MNTQTCKNSNCKQENPQPLHNFVKSSRIKSGFTKLCKSCKAEESRAYRASPEGKIATQQAVKKYSENNKDVSRKKSKKYRDQHPEKIFSYSKEYYSLNKDKILAKRKTKEAQKAAAIRQNKWRQENKELARARTAEWSRSDAGKIWRKAQRMSRKMKMRNLFVETVRRDVLYKRDNGKCQRCNKKFDFHDAWCIDHVWPVAKNGLHCYANVQILCVNCNSSKRDEIPNLWEMLKVYKRFLDYSGNT